MQSPERSGNEAEAGSNVLEQFFSGEKYRSKKKK